MIAERNEKVVRLKAVYYEHQVKQQLCVATPFVHKEDGHCNNLIYHYTRMSKFGAVKKAGTTVLLIADVATDVLYVAKSNFYAGWLRPLSIFFTCLPFVIGLFFTHQYDYKEKDGKCDFLKKYGLRMIDHSFILETVGFKKASEGRTAVRNKLIFSLAEDFPMLIITVSNSICMGETLGWVAVVSPCLSLFFFECALQDATMSSVKLNAGNRNQQWLSVFIGMMGHVPIVALLCVFMYVARLAP